MDYETEKKKVNTYLWGTYGEKKNMLPHSASNYLKALVVSMLDS